MAALGLCPRLKVTLRLHWGYNKGCTRVRFRYIRVTFGLQEGCLRFNVTLRLKFGPWSYIRISVTFCLELLLHSDYTRAVLGLRLGFPQSYISVTLGLYSCCVRVRIMVTL